MMNQGIIMRMDSERIRLLSQQMEASERLLRDLLKRAKMTKSLHLTDTFLREYVFLKNSLQTSMEKSPEHISGITSGRCIKAKERLHQLLEEVETYIQVK